LLDSREILELTSAQQAEVTEHLHGCESCDSEWRAVRALWEVSTLPAPVPRKGLFADAIRLATTTTPRTKAPARWQPSFWLGAGVGGAIAAAAVVAAMTWLLAPEAERGADAPDITIALNELHEVGVAIDAAEALTAAEIRVVLTGGVRLAGYADRSELSWTTDLDRGVNRLNLPLIAVTPAGGQVLVEVGHASKRQIFVVRVGVDAQRDDIARLRAAPAGSVAYAVSRERSNYVKSMEREPHAAV